MANILELLRTVLTESEARSQFVGSPRRYLEEAGFADLTGEDVAAAVEALRTTLPDDHAAALASLAAADHAAGVRPADGEDELDAAARVLGEAVVLVGGPGPGGASPELPADTGAPKSTRSRRGAKATAAGDAAESPASVPTDSPAAEPPRPDLSALPSITSFREVVEAASARVTQDAQALADRFAELLAAAEADLAELRTTAGEQVARWQEATKADRDAAKAALQSIDDDAEVLRQKAATHAERILADAQADAERATAEIEARWAELRRAEAQLAERVASIDSLFKTVLADEPGPTAAAPA